MKRVVLNCAVVFSLLLLMAGCKNSSDNITESHRGSGRIATQERTVGKFTSINVFAIGNVNLIQSDQESVRVEADDNIIDKVLTTVKDGTLTAGLYDNSGNYSNITVNIYVAMEKVDQLSITGTGNITANNSIEADTIHCTIAGAGNITIRGQGNHFDCLLAGAGNIMAESFVSKTCRARLNGTGNCYVNTSDDLDAAIGGIGSIYYYGNPKSVKTSITGTGQIVKK